LSPYALTTADVFGGGTTTALGQVPYGQWYREQGSCAHPRYTVVEGHPFLTTLPGSRDAAIYIGANDYDSVFQTLALKHWNSQGRVACTVNRFIPDVRRSIMAGTGLGA